MRPLKKFKMRPAARPGTRLVAPTVRQCQVDTPTEVVKFVWTQIRSCGRKSPTVLDLGAGDGRFALEGHYRHYTGYEIDPTRIAIASTDRFRVERADALTARGEFDVAVGNPPYVRSQDIAEQWRQTAVKLIEREAGTPVDLRANLYLYFMWLATLRTANNGLVAQLVPADWLVRPSAERFRTYLRSRTWHVTVLVFDQPRTLFPGVTTTLTLTIIDKAKSDDWSFFRVTPEFQVCAEVNGVRLTPLQSRRRMSNGLRAARGLSPGDQSVFVLTEKERVRAGIALGAVWPCVTTLRKIPVSLKTLSEHAFVQHYVKAGRRCWLLKTHLARISNAASRWLDRTPANVRTNGTCGRREPWYWFAEPNTPDIIYTSGFKTAGPRFVVNSVGAKAVGSVHGVFDAPNPSALARWLRQVDFVSASYRHANGLMKIEISQMNRLLHDMTAGGGA